MSIGSITIKEAITRGEKKIELPSKLIIISSLVLCIALPMMGLGWKFLLLLPIGLILSMLYTSKTRTKWRIWAYENVADIHQLQRSAELAGLLMRQSVNSKGLFQSSQQKKILQQLLQRFSEENTFVDDPSVPDDTFIKVTKGYFGSDNVIVLNSRGINVTPEGFCEWAEVENERIGHVSHNRQNARTGLYVTGSPDDYFRFECPLGRFNISVASLDVSTWELDWLLYMYRGRYNLNRSME